MQVRNKIKAFAEEHLATLLPNGIDIAVYGAALRSAFSSAELTHIALSCDSPSARGALRRHLGAMHRHTRTCNEWRLPGGTFVMLSFYNTIAPQELLRHSVLRIDGGVVVLRDGKAVTTIVSSEMAQDVNAQHISILEGWFLPYETNHPGALCAIAQLRAASQSLGWSLRMKHEQRLWRIFERSGLEAKQAMFRYFELRHPPGHSDPDIAMRAKRGL